MGAKGGLAGTISKLQPSIPLQFNDAALIDGLSRLGELNLPRIGLVNCPWISSLTRWPFTDKGRRDWTDIDKLNEEDPQACSAYAQSICEYLREAEVSCAAVITYRKPFFCCVPNM